MPKICTRFLFTIVFAYIFTILGSNVNAAPPTCTLDTSPSTFDSVTGVNVSANVQGIDQSETTLKWSASYGDITPVSPSSPINIDNEIIISQSLVGPNEFLNPSFESTPIEFWSIDNVAGGYAAVANGEKARTGTYSLKLHKDDAFGNIWDLRWVKDAGGFYPNPGDSYTAEAWVYTEHQSGGSFGTLQVVMTNFELSGGTWVATSWPTVTITESTNGWQKVTIKETVPANVTRVRMEFMLEGEGTVYIDDVYYSVDNTVGASNLDASSTWANLSQVDTPVTLTATVKNADGQNTCSKTVTPTIPAAASAPTCSIRVDQNPLYSDLGSRVYAEVENYEGSTSKIRWSSSYGGIIPESPSSPVDGSGFVTLNEGTSFVGSNELENYDMEGSDIRFWSLVNYPSDAYAAVSNGEEAHSGTRALKLFSDTWAGDDRDLRWLKDEGGFYVTPGDYYTAEVWVNAIPKANVSYVQAQMSLSRYRLEGGSWVFAGTTHAAVTESTNGWTKLSVTEQVPWNVTRISMEFRLGGAGTAYFDDAYFSSGSTTSATSFTASSNWISSQVTDAGVTFSAEVKNSAGSNTCSVLAYPKLPKTDLKIRVRDTNDISKATLEGYCTSAEDYSYATNSTTAKVLKIPDSSTYFEETGVFNSSYTKTIDSYPLSGETGVSYGFLLDTSANYANKEIKCIRHIKKDKNGATVLTKINPGGALTTFTATRDGTEEIDVVIGPKPVYPWFKAYGGQIYSFGGIQNDIPTLFGSYLESSTGLGIGPVTGKGAFDGSLPSIYVGNYDLGSSYIDKIINAVKANPTKVKLISNQSNINPNNPREMYLWDGSLPLVIDKDIKRLPNRLTPFVFVDGDVVIKPEVEELNVYLIASGKITLEERRTQDSVVNQNSCVTELGNEVWPIELFQKYRCGGAGCYWDTSQARKSHTFENKNGANFAIIENKWRWTGAFGDVGQKGEQHYVKTPLDPNPVFCKDLGDFGDFPTYQVYGNHYESVSDYDCDGGPAVLSGPVTGNISVEAYISDNLAPLQNCTFPNYDDCNGSHKAVVEVTWCDSIEVTQTMANPLVIYGGLLAKGVDDIGIEFERPVDNFDPIAYTMEELYFTPEIYWGEEDIKFFSVPNIFVTKID